MASSADHGYAHKKSDEELLKRRMNSTGNLCFAAGCRNRSNVDYRTIYKITFHRFPNLASEPERHVQWIKYCKKTKMATKYSVLCSAHFTEECFDRTGQTTRLRAGVVPSVHYEVPPKNTKLKSNLSEKRAPDPEPDSDLTDNEHDDPDLEPFYGVLDLTNESEEDELNEMMEEPQYVIQLVQHDDVQVDEENNEDDDIIMTYENIEVGNKDWRKVREERRAKKRKWEEERLMKEIQKKKDDEKREISQKLQDEQEAIRRREVGRPYTISIALPGSILDNAQSPELRTYLAGQIARAAVVFNVDEIVIFDESGAMKQSDMEGQYDSTDKKVQCNLQFARILQYLECPQYLRKAIFPHHKDLQYAGLLNPLDTPHHVKATEDSPFREGVVLQKPTKQGKGSFVDVGLRQEIRIDKQLHPGTRVTVRMSENADGSKKMHGKVVAPSTPRTDEGLYWGYHVRLAESLGTVFTKSPYKGGYDLLIGTSDKGSSVDEFEMPDFSHCLIVFGGVQGLEASLETDQLLQLDDPALLFNHYINTCPNQGSHTIRTEEAVLITLSSLRPKFVKHGSGTQS